MADDKEVLFSSFMAGLLLCRKSIKHPELCKEMEYFDNAGYTLIEPNGDFNKLALILDESNFSFTLKYDYGEFLGNITIYDYLYSITTEDVRKYFDIPEKEIVDNEKEVVVIRKKTLFDKFKRVKVTG